MNNVNLIGRLTRDPELKGIGGGKSVGEPTYVDVSTFGKHAEACAAHLAKGRQVAASGWLVFREWTARDGSKRSAHSVRGSVQFLGAKVGEGPRRAEPEEMALAF
jgi:single-strand DNA-binding protein